ncbi:beta-ketoacyl synthase chain length factor [Dinghuibacter silviterrae]|uniref:Beta-ketoacyl synthase-like protein n=1 Tax=Dinghuibacter silviterrae TaxID=1539049 RepID=A0A4R8DWF9_9BACT|nr:beta-ketoacyl synthase chain length factor [Dinghuibacter silviterrae]TDX02278.1 beta-ketoacyl synthase-like protein [Dinghuibacter silviterrae]
MNEKVYIRSAGIVSPLGGAAGGRLRQGAPAPADQRLRAVEPDYARLIDPKAIRRMSRVIRMGVAAALECLEGAGLWSPGGAPPASPAAGGATASPATGSTTASPAAGGATASPATGGATASPAAGGATASPATGSTTASPGGGPDAILTGTAYGCLEDTTVFLRRMVENREEMLTPTAFIQSTHNTVGAQIALMLQCHAYNNTFVHRGFSFEHALLDGMMLLQEGAAKTVLVGGVDEITDTSHSILSRFGLYRSGRINGEGAVFFLLDREPGSGICLEGMDTFYRPEDPAEHINAFLKRHPGDIDMVLGDQVPGEGLSAGTGRAGSTTQQLPAAEPFRHRCGDYPTASAFGLWLATEKVKAGAHSVLVYNNYLDIHHSLFLVKKC